MLEWQQTNKLGWCCDGHGITRFSSWVVKKERVGHGKLGASWENNIGQRRSGAWNLQLMGTVALIRIIKRFKKFYTLDSAKTSGNSNSRHSSSSYLSYRMPKVWIFATD
jgi:hypothetical protein